MFYQFHVTHVVSPQPTHPLDHVTLAPPCASAAGRRRPPFFYIRLCFFFLAAAGRRPSVPLFVRLDIYVNMFCFVYTAAAGRPCPLYPYHTLLLCVTEHGTRARLGTGGWSKGGWTTLGPTLVWCQALSLALEAVYIKRCTGWL